MSKSPSKSWLQLKDTKNGVEFGYRIATYPEFLKSQLNALSVTPVKNNQGISLPSPWRTYDVNESGNPINALMQGWSMVLDCLTFYQERLLNEGYLQTATEQYSILELGNEVGYHFNKGLPAMTYLSFTATKPKQRYQPIEVPKGTAVKSVPIAKGEAGQIFETMEKSTIYFEWNEIPVVSFSINAQNNHSLNTSAITRDTEAMYSGTTEPGATKDQPPATDISKNVGIQGSKNKITRFSQSTAHTSHLQYSTHTTTTPYGGRQVLDETSTEIVLSCTSTLLKPGDQLVILGLTSLDYYYNNLHFEQVQTTSDTPNPKWFGVAIVSKLEIDKQHKTTIVTLCSPLLYLRNFNQTPVPKSWKVDCDTVQAIRFSLQANLYGYKAPSWFKLSDKKKLEFQDSFAYRLCSNNSTKALLDYQINQRITDFLKLSDQEGKNHRAHYKYFIATFGGGIVARIEETGKNTKEDWRTTNDGLGSLKVNALEFLESRSHSTDTTSSVLFAATQDSGVYASYNGGDNWHSAIGNMYTNLKTGVTSPRSIVSPITNVFSKKNNTLVVGTSSGAYILSQQLEDNLPMYSGCFSDSADSPAIDKLISSLNSPSFTLTKVPTALPINAKQTVKVAPTQSAKRTIDLNNGFAFSVSNALPPGEYIFSFTVKGQLFDVEITEPSLGYQLYYVGIDLKTSKSRFNAAPITITYTGKTPIVPSTSQSQYLKVNKKGNVVSAGFNNNLTVSSAPLLKAGTYVISIDRSKDGIFSYSLTNCYPLGSFWDYLPLLPKNDAHVTSLLLTKNISENEDKSLLLFAGTSKGNIYVGTFHPKSPNHINPLATFSTKATQATPVSSIAQWNDHFYAAFKEDGVYCLNLQTANKESIWPATATTKRVNDLALSKWNNINSVESDVSSISTLFAATDKGLFYNQATGFDLNGWREIDPFIGVSGKPRSGNNIQTVHVSSEKGHSTENLYLGCMPNQYSGFYIKGKTIYLDSKYTSIVPNQTALKEGTNDANVINNSWILLSQNSGGPAFSIKSLKSVDTVYRREFGLPGSKITRLEFDSDTSLEEYSIRATTISAQSSALPIAKIPLTKSDFMAQEINDISEQAHLTINEVKEVIKNLRSVKPTNIANGLVNNARSIKHLIKVNITKAKLQESIAQSLESTVQIKNSLVQIKTALTLPGVSSTTIIDINKTIEHVSNLHSRLNRLVPGRQNTKTLCLHDNESLEPGKLICITGHTEINLKDTISEIARIAEIDTHSKLTVITLETALRNDFVLKGLKINANLIEANQGYSVINEVLGSGNSTLTQQYFALKRSPLTYIDKTTNSLCVYVNGTVWKEVATLAGCSSESRVYYIRTDETGKTWVHFGDGLTGSRLPTGHNNVVADYRFGMGRNGNCPPKTIKQLIKPPKGVKHVTNPVSAIGGLDAETIGAARKNINYANHYYDRIVTDLDYFYFCSTYPGISKVRVDNVSIGKKLLICVTVCPLLDGNSKTTYLDTGLSSHSECTNIVEYQEINRRLLKAILMKNQPNIDVTVRGFKLVRFGANLLVTTEKDCGSKLLRQNVNKELDRYFSTTNREIARDVNSAEIQATVQGVRGVLGVTVESMFTGGPVNSLQRQHTTVNTNDHRTLKLNARSASWNSQLNTLNLAEMLIIDIDLCTITVINSSSTTG